MAGADEKRQWIKIDYDRKYSFSTIVLFFFSFAFVGWVWEVFYTLLNEGVLANRGTMFGPWLPIYGVGGLLIIVGLRPLRKNPGLLFMGAFAACGALEYFAAWALETLFHTKWWDYTGYFLNVNGRICLEGLFVFGLAGVAPRFIPWFLGPNIRRYTDRRFDRGDGDCRSGLSIGR